MVGGVAVKWHAYARGGATGCCAAAARQESSSVDGKVETILKAETLNFT
jgi:hypothetical protein